jgi:membrane-associated protein
LETIRHLLHLITTVEGLTELIRWGGLAALTAIVFAETGLLIGFFLPGDSLLVTAGFVAATTDILDLSTLLVVLCIAAVVGDSTGYAIGRKAGPPLYNRPDSRFFKREHLLRTKEFYERYGGSTIVLARFMPFVRTFAPVVAGIAQMNYRRFVVYNVVGGVGWVCSMTLVGYFFGQIPFVQRHMEKVIVLVIVLSVLPIVLHWWKARRQSRTNGATPAVSAD